MPHEHCNGNCNHSTSLLGAVLVGGLVGAALGLLYAPRSGEETREMVKKKAQDVQKMARDKMHEAQHMMEEKSDEVRAKVQRAARELKR